MNIKFVSYTGKYPNLCSGILTLNIDGNDIKFGHELGSFDYKKGIYTDSNYTRFWSSGGCITSTRDWGFGNFDTKHAKWKVSYTHSDEYPEYNLPKEFEEHLDELIEVFNDNVSWGCCGGCI